MGQTEGDRDPSSAGVGEKDPRKVFTPLSPSPALGSRKSEEGENRVCGLALEMVDVPTQPCDISVPFLFFITSHLLLLRLYTVSGTFFLPDLGRGKYQFPIPPPSRHHIPYGPRMRGAEDTNKQRSRGDMMTQRTS